jgi:hypothetical protein
MDKREKVDFILEQMRLCLAKSDYIRTQIISKKINTKFFQDKENEVKRKQSCRIFAIQTTHFFIFLFGYL